jgi:PAS domain S-box-containing protein
VQTGLPAPFPHRSWGGFLVKTSRKLLIWIVAAALFAALGVAISFLSFSQIGDAANDRTQAAALLRGGNQFMASLVDAETGQRGYLLTGNESYLEPYLAVRTDIVKRLQALRDLTVVLEAERHLDALVPLVDARLDHMSRVIDMRRSGDLPAAMALITSGEGKRLMDAIRIEMAAFIGLAEVALAQRDTGLQLKMTRLFNSIVVASLLTVLLTLAFAYFLYQRMHQRVKNLMQNAGTLQSAIFNSANFSSIATDAHGVIQIFNVGAERMLGYTAAEVMNKITPADISDPQELIARAHALSTELDTRIKPGFEALVFKASRGIEDIYELTYIRKDGSRFPAVVSVTALRDEQSAIIGYLLIGTDNTARRQVEAERVQLEQVLRDQNTELERARAVADKANVAKSDFLSSMSHELRTPLNAILGFAQLLASGKPVPTPLQQRNLGQILKAGWYLLELINEILDLALIESGKTAISAEPVALAEVLNECRTMMEPQADQRGITTTFPQLARPLYVEADRTRFKQSLINLLSNAIKYNRPGGIVDVECKLCPPDSIRISVRDTGEGMTPDLLGQLFQPFNRLGKESSREEGTGIGLVVTKQLVERMGGRVGVDSTVGVGTMFWIELPQTAPPQLAHDELSGAGALSLTEVQPLPDGPPRRTVLYVEDNPANLELVEQLIARRPELRMLSAADGSLGVEFARAHLPDVILMDIHLPGISGVEAMKILRADPVTAHIPIIALSANAVPRDITACLEAGFFDYLTKPIKVDVFTAALDAAMNFPATESSLPAAKEAP